MNFSMMQYHKWSLTELEHMIPWEKELYTMMLIQHVKEENEKAEMASRG